MGTIMTAQMVDQKEKGVAIPNADHSMKLPPDKMHSMGYELYQFSPSKLPPITKDLARITKMMIHDTSSGADWDKFKGDPAYRAASAERYKTVNARVPVIKTWAKVTRPNDILDMERCESINTSARQINRHWMIQQALLLEDAQSAFMWSMDGVQEELDARDEKLARKFQADGKGSDVLRLRHEESETAPFGLYNLQYALEHDKGRFFRIGGGTETVASQSTIGSSMANQSVPIPTVVTTLPLQTTAQPDASTVMLQQLQQQQQHQVNWPTATESATAIPSVTMGTGQQMPRFGLDINITGGAVRQNQFGQRQFQNQGQFGQRQFQNQNQFGQREFQNPGQNQFGQQQYPYQNQLRQQGGGGQAGANQFGNSFRRPKRRK
jgi:hypothetical protein